MITLKFCSGTSTSTSAQQTYLPTMTSSRWPKYWFCGWSFDFCALWSCSIGWLFPLHFQLADFWHYLGKVEVGLIHIIFIFSSCQIVDICEDHQKESKLARLLEEIGDGSKILVFVETKRKCDELTRLLLIWSSCGTMIIIIYDHLSPFSILCVSWLSLVDAKYAS